MDSLTLAPSSSLWGCINYNYKGTPKTSHTNNLGALVFRWKDKIWEY